MKLKLIKNIGGSWQFASVWVAAITAALAYAQETVAAMDWLPEKWVVGAMVLLVIARLINFTPEAGE